MVYSYKETLDHEKISLNAPEKNTGKQWACEVSYDNSKFLIKTPRIKIDKQTGVLIFKVENKKDFIDCLESVENIICENIHKNSEKFFSGKSFSKDKIISSVSPSWDIDDSGYAYLQPSMEEKELKDIKCLDMFNNAISYKDLQENVSVILHVKSVSFVKKLFTINYKIDLIKMTKFTEKVNDPFDVEIVTSKIAEVEINPTVNEELQDETVLQENKESHDNADFFD
jgi:hypothetical protein